MSKILRPRLEGIYLGSGNRQRRLRRGDLQLGHGDSRFRSDRLWIDDSASAVEDKDGEGHTDNDADEVDEVGEDEDKIGDLFRPQWDLFCAQLKQDVASGELLSMDKWSAMIADVPDLASLLATPLMVRIFFDVLPVFLERKRPVHVRQAVFAASDQLLRPT